MQDDYNNRLPLGPEGKNETVKAGSGSPALNGFSPLVSDWFFQRFDFPTEAQKLVWPVARRGENLLLTSPTGTGKTLAAFLSSLDSLIRGDWDPGVLSVLYVSPLKALNRDIRLNLEEPLEELRNLAREKSLQFPDIRIETRSGDTDNYRRRRMLDKPPAILITTPESLNILLATQRGRAIFSSLRCVILDEIHALAGNKRGTQLVSALERLALLLPERREFQRIALSATLADPGIVATFAAGFRADGLPRKMQVLESGDRKKYDLRIEAIPDFEPESRENSDTPWKRLAEQLKPEIQSGGSSLVFVNSRRLAEKIAFLLNRDEEEPLAYAHHGSLSKEIRTLVEERLKSGKLRCIVATNSLELGIDIGELDRIILVQTPFSLSSAVQKIGRAGHSVGGISRGKLFCSHGRDFLSALSLARGLREGILEKIVPPRLCLDVLAQIVIGEALAGEKKAEKIYKTLQQSYPYRDLDRESFYGVLEMLQGFYHGIRVNQLPGRIRLKEGQIEVLPSGRSALFSSGGTIPDRGYYILKEADRSSGSSVIGELDEEFVWERRTGDVFTFGTRNWRIVGISPRTVEVRPTASPVNSSTFYRAEPLYRDYAAQRLSGEILGEYFSRRLLPDSLESRFNVSREGGEKLRDYLHRLENQGVTPHGQRIVAEYTRGLRGAESPYLVFIHTLWGGRCNAPLALALEELLRKKDSPASVSWDNDSILITSPQALEEGLLFQCRTGEITGMIESGLVKSGIFGARFREAAARSLVIARTRYGERTPLWLSRLRAKRLLSAVADKQDFPLLQEALRECLEELFDIPLLISLLNSVERGDIEYREVTTGKPSPLCSGSFWEQMNAQIYSDDVPEISIRTRGEWAYRIAAGEVLRPRIDDQIVRDFTARLRRLARGYRPENIQELEDILKERQVIPAAELEGFTAELDLPADTDFPWKIVGEARRWAVHKERIKTLQRYLGPEGRGDEEFREIFLSWLYYEGPCYPEDLILNSPFNTDLVREFLQVETEEESLVNDYISSGAEGLQLIHREGYEFLLGFSRSRGKVSAWRPLPLNRYYEFLSRHQGVDSPGTAEDVVFTLEGFRLVPEIWENAVFPRRMKAYSREKIDSILEDREIVWIGAPRGEISFFRRENIDCATRARQGGDQVLPSTGGFTFWEIVDMWGKSSRETLQLLWKELRRGRISCDSWTTLLKGPPNLPEEPRTGRSGFARWKSRLPLKGNWFSVPRPAEEPDELEKLDSARAAVRLLFGRYPVLFREELHREVFPFRWRDIFTALRLMEFSGEIISGAFIEDVPGIQFTLPDYLPRLAGVIDDSEYPDRLTVLHINDPASPAGVPLENPPDSAPPRRGDHWAVYRNGRTVLVYGKKSGRLEVQDRAAFPEAMEKLVNILKDLPSHGGKISLRSVNNTPVHSSDITEDLRSLGFVAGLRDFSLYS